MFMFMLRHCRTLVALVLAAVASAATAQSYNVADDFSLVSNPNSVWSYGYSTTLTSSPLLYDVAGVFTYEENGVPNSLDSWRTNFDINLGAFKNNTGHSYSEITTFEAGEFALHPGALGEYSHVVWTAPTAGAYTLDARFRLNAPGGVDAHLLIDGSEVLSTTLVVQGQAVSYSSGGTLLLSAGSKIAFVVGTGAMATVSIRRDWQHRLLPFPLPVHCL
jgi:hypothetical protein